MKKTMTIDVSLKFPHGMGIRYRIGALLIAITEKLLGLKIEIEIKERNL